MTNEAPITETSQARAKATQKAVVASWRERQDALGYRGKAADKALLDFVCGAHVGLQIARPGVSTGLEGLIFAVSVRGVLGLLGL